MKILYAIQGTGNGHLSRARDIIPLLQKKGNLDLLVSGTQADVALPYPIQYRCHGLSFVFGKNGGIDFVKTAQSFKPMRLWREIFQFPIEQYDLIINDFEPISAWAARLKNKPVIALSHQAALLSKHVPKPNRKDFLGEFILKRYAPASAQYGFHFKGFDENIYTPVIRQQVRDTPISAGEHFTVYLPAFDDVKLVQYFQRLKAGVWEIFSKHTSDTYQTKNINVLPIDNEKFIKSMASSQGVLCGAGFETPAEALFLQKKLLVIPMKNQYEQHYNAKALEEIGVTVLPNLTTQQIPILENWRQNSIPIAVNFPDITHEIIHTIIKKHTQKPAMTVSPQ